MQDRVAAWVKAQGEDIEDWMTVKPVALGPILSDAWVRDPKRLLFTLSRYKFVAKMLHGEVEVAEVGAGDGFASRLVEVEVTGLDLYDLAPLRDDIYKHDIAIEPLSQRYNAIYSLDVLEHIKDIERAVINLKNSLNPRGRLVIGMPSKESQIYASEPSRRLHVNCLSGEELRSLMERHFYHVFLFSMNDEVVHTGFLPLAHYLFAVCAEPR